MQQNNEASPEKQERIKECMRGIMEATAKAVVLFELMNGVQATEFTEVMEMKSVMGDSPSRYFVLSISQHPPGNNPVFANNMFQ